MLTNPAPELVLEAARVVIAEKRLESFAQAGRLLDEAEEWGAGVCCPEALLEYRERRFAAEADPAAAWRTLLVDVSLMLDEARRSIDTGLAAAWRTRAFGVWADEPHEVAARLVALRTAAMLLTFPVEAMDDDIAVSSASADWQRLDQYFCAIHRLWAAHLASRVA
jgi:hypothetical protein